ncbi:MAG: hypothetical protein K9J24_01825 [Bacteroidales bacterium]|nr:hypothetical protein [Bacteroidales bacterium]
MDYNRTVNNMPSVMVEVSTNGKRGKMWLCSTYGCYDHETDLQIPHEAIVDFYCPHCQEKLNTLIKCQVCDATMVKFNIEIGGVVSICSRNGCKNHYVMFEDLESAIRKYTREYGI